MAFNMNRPMIKGTKLHKASIAKVKQSIVSQARMKADPTLVAASTTLGESKVPHAIDFSLDVPDITVKEKKKKSDKISSSKSDYGTYQEYVDDHKSTKAKMSDKDKKAYGDPISEDEWYSKKEHENIERPKREQQEITSIEPKTARLLPTNNKLAELRKSTGTVETTEHKDRFFEAAKKAGIDIKTTEDYEKAERVLVYDEKLDNWRERKEEITASKPTIGEIGESTDVYQQKIDAGKNYQLSADDMVSDGQGGYVPKEGAKSTYGDTWDSKVGGWRDDAEEQYYGPKGQKISKATADKLSDAQQVKFEKRKELEEKNKVIKEKNALIRQFKKDNPGERVTQSALDTYQEQLKFEEELSDLDELDSEPYKIEQQQIKEKKDEPKAFTSGQLRRLDKKWENSGPNVRANMKEDGYVPKNARQNSSAMQMRDDRIWKFAKKEGPVHQNMRKDGYIPLNER